MFFPPRKGSGKMAWGFRSTSESSPGAWPVEEPSKFQMGLWREKKREDEWTDKRGGVPGNAELEEMKAR